MLATVVRRGYGVADLDLPNLMNERRQTLPWVPRTHASAQQSGNEAQRCANISAAALSPTITTTIPSPLRFSYG
jgi:hypothetical protein